jgi:hypothetical protein
MFILIYSVKKYKNQFFLKPFFTLFRINVYNSKNKKMKKVCVLLLFVILTTSNYYSQQEFVFNKIDSVAKTKTQLYSDTKVFIAETWKSAQSAIQNDDKEAGFILVKGYSDQISKRFGGYYEYGFNYTVKFLFKDNKVKCVIENITCNNGYWKSTGTPSQCTCHSVYADFERSGMFDCSKKDWDVMVGSLKLELQGILDSYFINMKKKSQNADW